MSFNDASPGATLSRHFESNGIAIIEYALTREDLAQMDAHFPQLGAQAGARSDAFTVEARFWLAGHEGLQEIAHRLSGGRCALTRLQAFDKSEQANWFVPWHQDRAEAGRERAVPFLENTVALRIHLDDCDEDNGPLEVIAGSHVHGRLAAEATARIAARKRTSLCLAVRGDIVAMRPLLLHRSQRAKTPRARRVIHIEYTRCDVLQFVRQAEMAS